MCILSLSPPLLAVSLFCSTMQVADSDSSSEAHEEAVGAGHSKKPLADSKKVGQNVADVTAALTISLIMTTACFEFEFERCARIHVLNSNGLLRAEDEVLPSRHQR